MPDFAIVDAHVHLYDPDTLRYGWLDAVPPIRRRFGLAEFDRARGAVMVDRIVFVEAAADPGQHLDEARLAAELAAREPRLAGIVAHAPVEKGRGVEDDLAALAELGGVCGVRRLIQGEADPSVCLAADFLDGVRRLAAFRFTFDICVKHWGLAYAIELARRCPGVTFVLDHIGKPDIRHGLTEPWRTALRALARLPNVVCKVSGVITEADRNEWSRDELAPYLDHVFATFGCDRLMFGSDWPVSELTHAYPTWVAILDDTLAGASEDERMAFWRGTAIRTYGLT